MSPGDRRNYEFRPGNELAKFKGSPVACATLDIYEDLDYEGDMEFAVLLVDVYPVYFIDRGNIRTDFVVRDSAGKLYIVIIHCVPSIDNTICAYLQMHWYSFKNQSYKYWKELMSQSVLKLNCQENYWLILNLRLPFYQVEQEQVRMSVSEHHDE